MSFLYRLIHGLSAVALDDLTYQVVGGRRGDGQPVFLSSCEPSEGRDYVR